MQPSGLHPFHTGYGPDGQIIEHFGGGERCAHRQVQAHLSGFRRRSGPGSLAQLGGRGSEYLPDGGLELRHVIEAHRVRDLDERQRGGLDQRASCLGALCTGKLPRAGARFLDQQPIQVALSRPQGVSQPAQADTVEDTIGDQPHRARCQVVANLPFWRPGCGIRPATLTGPQPGTLRSRSRRMECDVVTFRWAGRAAGTAIDSGRVHPDHDPAVEAGVLAQHRVVATVEIGDHGRCLGWPTFDADAWRCATWRSCSRSHRLRSRPPP